jgi:peptide/nickel transport system permease protein
MDTLKHWRLIALIGSYLVTVLFLLALNFFIPRAIPGDPISALEARGSSTYVHDAATRQALERYYGLDRPLLPQYGHYLAALARGDLGRSIESGKPVADLVAERLPWTLLLVGTAVAIATTVGLIAGVHSGWRRGRALDRGLLGVFLGLQNLPGYFLATLALIVFAVKLHWFPLAGARSPFSGSWSLLRQLPDIADHLVLPALVVAVGLAASNYLVMRAGMVSELGADYLVLGRAKGVSERGLKYRYAARNALLPVVTITALQLSFALTIAIFAETVFAYPGMGRLLFDAVANRDYPVLQGCFLVLTTLVLTINLVAEGVYVRLDPRTRAR